MEHAFFFNSKAFQDNFLKSALGNYRMKVNLREMVQESWSPLSFPPLFKEIIYVFKCKRTESHLRIIYGESFTSRTLGQQALVLFLLQMYHKTDKYADKYNKMQPNRSNHPEVHDWSDRVYWQKSCKMI